MRLIRRVFILLVISIGFSTFSYAGWKGPTMLVTLGFGNQTMQVALEHGDTQDLFPHQFKVDKEGYILLADSLNARLLVFSPKGILRQSIKPINLPSVIYGWPLRLTLLNNSRVLIKRGDKYQIYNYNDGTLANEFIGVATHILQIESLRDDSIVVYKGDERQYYQYSSNGNLIGTFKTAPKEIQYPDNTSFSYEVTGKLVRKLNECKKVIDELILPADQIFSEYGDPFIAPNGDVYTWKRTPEKYSILKWTWINDKNISSPKCNENIPSKNVE